VEAAARWLLPTAPGSERVAGCCARPADVLVLIELMGGQCQPGASPSDAGGEGVDHVTYIALPGMGVPASVRAAAPGLSASPIASWRFFPKRSALLRRAGNADVTWVGHPLLDTLSEQPSREEARQQLGLRQAETLLLLLPRSRKPGDMRYLVPTLAAAAAELQRQRPGLRVDSAGGQAHSKPAGRPVRASGCVRGEVVARRSGPTACGRPLCRRLPRPDKGQGLVNLSWPCAGCPRVGYRVSRPQPGPPTSSFFTSRDHNLTA